ncbi:MAG: hypothetical protein VXZ40_02175 [Nanoarchaeota archaeon]|nr:hypothetical protein [Nanoarchaeota archaeon]
MSKEKFISNTDVFDTLGRGFDLMKSKFWFLMGITIVTMILGSIGDGELFSLVIENTWTASFLSLVYSFLIAAPIGIGYLWVMYLISNGKKVKFSNLFDLFERNYINAILASILVTFIILIGFIALIIPGIYFAVKLFFVNILIIDKKMDSIQAIKASWKLTEGYFWKILGLTLMYIPIIIGGLLLLIVGIIPAVAWISASQAVMYNSIQKEK